MAAILLLFPSYAHAEWFEASSAHFVVYANDSEVNVRRFSDRLERYRSAMGYLLDATLVAPSPSNRVAVYVVRDVQEVQRLMGDGSANVAGFYVPRAGASLAIVPRVQNSTGKYLDFSMTVLLHEYAHHYVSMTSSFPLPRWLSEGSAEFFASAGFSEDGGVQLGRVAAHRAGELLYGQEVKLQELLAPKGDSVKGEDFYGKSWLLYHYLTFDATRKGQLGRYVDALSQGRGPVEAATEAFGDFAKLDRDLDRYMRSRMLMFTIPAKRLEPGPITMRRLTPGEIAILPVRLRSRSGVTDKTAPKVLADARAVAARFPNEAPVLAALAEAEHDAGNDREAIAAADAALAIDPQCRDAYVQKGLAQFRMAREADDPRAAHRLARLTFVALNKIEPDHPIPLIYYYQSFLAQGFAIPTLAIAGLKQAVELAPYDLSLKMMLAAEQLRGGDREGARRSLAPVAYNPHGGSYAEAARTVLARIDSEPNWDGRSAADQLMTAASAEEKALYSGLPSRSR